MTENQISVMVKFDSELDGAGMFLTLRQLS
ncbi:protein of unknown function [Brevefilum fermentans]|uniref:Uncharacterized protein n=1 Tax=Candidatus Brevifilum fermentans TaxID=1986204 RepID=A0A1Y6K3M5_9CHLR|nr:protein of unknown function [Brevefilum fermentans]